MSITSTCCSCSSSSPIFINTNRLLLLFNSIPRRRIIMTRVPIGGGLVRASTLDSPDSSNFANRIETAWLISQQPRPVACTSCDSNGNVDCKWCHGTGFFILGDNMLCQVASHNTSCVICSGKGSVCCTDCKGTGYRAKWLKEPPISKQ